MQLTTCRIGNLTRVDPSLAIYIELHTYNPEVPNSFHLPAPLTVRIYSFIQGSRSRSPRPKKPKQTIENRYSVQNSWGSDPSPSSEEDGHRASGSVPSETRVIPPPISTERSPTEDVVEPLSPGEAHWRRMFGLRPSRSVSLCMFEVSCLISIAR